jgi:hypothetical protein
MKATRKIKESKKLESKLDYSKIWDYINQLYDLILKYLNT